MSSPPHQDIVIAGGGTAGWMAASAFARFLGSAATITVVESDVIGTVGVGEATIPQIHLFLAGLGIDEPEFVAATKATFKLGIEFVDWLRPGHRYMHAFGVVGRGNGITPFRQFWRRALATGAAEPFGAYSFNEVAARAGRMSRTAPGHGSGPDLVYAYHFDATRFAAFLRAYAERRGVRRNEGKIVGVERDSCGDIVSLLLDDDRRVTGSLFIDCTGFRSLLLGEALAVPFVDWSGDLPCDRAFAVPCANNDAFRPFTQAIAHRAGWQWRIPLQHRTGNGLVYCSRFLSDDDAKAMIAAGLEGEALDEPRQLRFVAGRREAFWAHNCIAMGLAAGFLEPLESTSIHLVQSAIARLLQLLPGDEDVRAARETFNRLSTMEWERVRDFLVLHYWANERHGEPFWDERRARDPSLFLERKLELFRGSGHIVREDEELFTEEGWQQVLIGQGIIPRSWSPLADQVPPDEIRAYLEAIARSHCHKAEALPSHRQFVEAMVAQAPLARKVLT